MSAKRRDLRPAPGRPRAGTHAAASAGTRRARCASITVSDTRVEADDLSGARARALLEAAGHVVAARHRVPDEAAAIRRAVLAMLRDSTTDVVVLTGGTGITARDVTPEALESLIEKPLPGFGELFRQRSFEEVGTAAWLSRAGAGEVRGRLVVFLPGSPAAVELGLRDVLIPELAHILRMLGRTSQGD
jgi:molybdenum cofactor biosynthesis protein B